MRCLIERFLVFFFAFLGLCSTEFATTSALSTQQQQPSFATTPPPPPLVFNKKKMSSFYQRPLPSTCTAFSSPLGRRIFASALQNGGLKSFFALMEQHTTQTEPAYCGLATLVVALNAMAVDPRQDWKTPWRWYHEELLPCCRDFDLEKVKKTGITMADFRCLAICHGLGVDVYYADGERTSLEGFRESILQVCVEKDEEQVAMDTAENEALEQHKGQALSQVLVVSYDRKSMGQTGSGHFSPIAAYDSITDSVLILDTARFKYGCHWVKVPLLFEALQPIDKDSGRSRGYIILTNERETSSNQSNNDDGITKPQTLLRPLKSPVATRQQEDLLAFLNNKKKASDLSWEEFRAFWTRNDTDSGHVWYFCEPSIKPCQKEHVQAIDSALDELRSHMRNHIQRSVPDALDNCQECRPNLRRSVPLLHTEAIYLLFLACLKYQFDEPAGRSVSLQSDLLQASIATLTNALFP